MLKRKMAAAWLAVIMMLSGCASVGNDVTGKNIPDINPRAESANKDTSNVRLYYSYKGEQLLAGETRSIDVPVSQKREQAVVEALIAGPSADRSELTGLFWDGVTLVSVENNADNLFVTLSEEFITTDPPTSALEEYTALNRKMLAIYSIVDTITEMGTYSRVQINVQRKDGSQRIMRSEAGFKGEDKALDPLYWDGDLILTPEKTLAKALDLYSKKNWTELYNYTAYTDVDGTVKPDSEDFSAALGETGSNGLDSFEPKGVNVSNDGQTAVVLLNYTIKTRNGDVERTMVPVIMVNEGELWKVSYSSINNVLINVG